VRTSRERRQSRVVPRLPRPKRRAEEEKPMKKQRMCSQEMGRE
jgi:hypothetical protein